MNGRCCTGGKMRRVELVLSFILLYYHICYSRQRKTSKSGSVMSEACFTFWVFTCSSYCGTCYRRREWWGLPRQPTGRRKSESPRPSTPDTQREEGEKELVRQTARKRDKEREELGRHTERQRLCPNSGSVSFDGVDQHIRHFWIILYNNELMKLNSVIVFGFHIYGDGW